ncbi:MAG: hypothetical protein ACYSWP_20400 [Planctomycetota bacterium]|jgi:hypothetical protein
MKKILTLSIITFISIFLIGTTLVTADGNPFEVLQQQIDDLQQQINDLQTGTVSAYVKKSNVGYISSGEENAVDVLTLSLPAGIFINTITLNANWYPNHMYEHDSFTDLYCEFVDPDGNSVTGDTVEEMVNGHDILAKTVELTPHEPMVVILSCWHRPRLGDEEQLIRMGNAVWTAIKVDELDRQNEIEP